MNEMQFQAADLPRLMLVTQRAMMVPFAQVLEAALEDGARLIQLREKDMGPEELLALTRRTRDLCRKFGARLLVNGRSSWCPGVHAHFSVQAWRRRGRMLGGNFRGGHRRGNAFFGASVHSLDEARSAQALGASYLTFGSIFPTASHPEGTPLGLQVLEQVAREVRIPVYAIGGITSGNACSCLEAGAHGVAAIRAAWNPQERRELLRVVGEF